VLTQSIAYSSSSIESRCFGMSEKEPTERLIKKRGSKMVVISTRIGLSGQGQVSFAYAVINNYKPSCLVLCRYVSYHMNFRRIKPRKTCVDQGGRENICPHRSILSFLTIIIERIPDRR
jgi:hypothetical protein